MKPRALSMQGKSWFTVPDLPGFREQLPSINISFLAVIIKYPEKSNLRKKRLILAHSSLQGSQGDRNLKLPVTHPQLRADRERIYICMLTAQLALSFPFNRRARSGRVYLHQLTHLRKKKSFTGRPTGQSYLDNSSLRLSSNMILNYVNVNPTMTPTHVLAVIKYYDCAWQRLWLSLV